MTGTVTGGWEFVWAAYGLTFSILAVYISSVLMRYRSEKQRSDRERHQNREVMS
jgi:heme exporter protein CcmD